MKRFVLKGRGIEPTYRIPYEEELNEEQLRAVLAGEGPKLVIAGAGSGKTRTLTYRVARLVESQVPPDSILLLTFTNKASREMLHRVETLLGTSSLRVVGGTFHHVGNLILRQHAAALGLTPSYTIIDRGDARDLVRSVVAELQIDTRQRRMPSPDALVSIYSFAVNTMRPLEEVVEERYTTWLDEIPDIVRIVAAYRERKRRIGVMDYDDLLLYWLGLLEEQPAIADALRRRFAYVLVDEYQDTNKLQGLIIDAMARDHRNITVVGDDAQSIYAFRGAHFANILTFPDRYADAEVFRLETNYRSQPAILELANASIGHNTRQFPKELRAMRPPGTQPLLASCRDVYQQASLVAEYVLALFDEGREPADVAVLYRSNFQSLEIQAEMTRRKIPFAVFGGIRFFEQAHIKDVIAYLRVLENRDDELAWMRVLPLLPKVGTRTAAKLMATLREALPQAGTDARLGATAWGAVLREAPRGARAAVEGFLKLLDGLLERRAGAPADLLTLVLDSGYEEHLKEKHPNWRSRREDLSQLVVFAGTYRTLSEFLSELALLDATQAETVVTGPDSGRPVTLTTVHQAKGLEWPCVIVAGLSDGAFPSSMSLREADGEEEERRLFYVAVTRAKDELLLAFPATRVVRGQGLVIQKPSRFVAELPDIVTEELEVADPAPYGSLGRPPSALPRGRDDEGFADPLPTDDDYFHD